MKTKSSFFQNSAILKEKLQVTHSKFQQNPKINNQGHIELEDGTSPEELDSEVSKIFLKYLNHVDQECLGLSEKSITKTSVDAGVAVSKYFIILYYIIYIFIINFIQTIMVTFPASVALMESIKLPKATQLFEAASETR